MNCKYCKKKSLNEDEVQKQEEQMDSTQTCSICEKTVTSNPIAFIITLTGVVVGLVGNNLIGPYLGIPANISLILSIIAFALVFGAIKFLGLHKVH